MSHNRMSRIGDEIRRELAQLLLTKINDPRLHQLSVTAVNVSPDMANATVLVSMLNDSHVKETLQVLNRARGFLRRELAHSLNLRNTPQLKFSYDESILQADRLIHLINSVNLPKSSIQDE